MVTIPLLNFYGSNIFITFVGQNMMAGTFDNESDSFIQSWQLVKYWKYLEMTVGKFAG